MSGDQIVVGTAVTPEATDVAMLEPMITNASDNLAAAGSQEPIGAVLADAGYWSHANSLIEDTLDSTLLLIAPGDKTHKVGDPPPPLSDTATDATRARHRMQTRLADPDNRDTYRQRGWLIEGTFAHTKTHRRASRFSRRGLAACQAEWTLIHLAGNITTIHRAGPHQPDNGPHQPDNGPHGLITAPTGPAYRPTRLRTLPHPPTTTTAAHHTGKATLPSGEDENGRAASKAVRGPTITCTSDKIERFSNSARCESATAPLRPPPAFGHLPPWRRMKTAAPFRSGEPGHAPLGYCDTPFGGGGPKGQRFALLEGPTETAEHITRSAFRTPLSQPARHPYRRPPRSLQREALPVTAPPLPEAPPVASILGFGGGVRT